jgi:F-BAR domain only protein
VAPNPAFIEQVPNKPGTYTVDLSKITKTSVAFHYQVHLDSNNLATFSPIVLSPAWKIEATQASAIVSYSLNPAFVMPASVTSLTITNLILVIRLDPTAGKPKSCQSKPVGNFSKDRSLIYWRLGDVTLTSDETPKQIRVRFLTETEAKAGNVEARWEISNNSTKDLGSGIAVSRMTEGAPHAAPEEKDPFADDGEPAIPNVGWTEVNGVKKIGSGTYVAIPPKPAPSASASETTD